VSDRDFSQVKRLPVLPKSVASLVVGVLSCEMGWAYGIPGIILGAIGLSMANQAQRAAATYPNAYRGYKLAESGCIWSMVGLVQGIILTVAYVVFFIFIAAYAVADSYSYR